eukprot:comp23835_c0_seq1/m.41598 comp23835_c0_seq1/g.41598  ORF comp23835_c0_seq1/g.41598 comp23835_c0_seq1/m.41598 type:complete len:682 (-) comp23835_c0_seq1:568-2613(-)
MAVGHALLAALLVARAAQGQEAGTQSQDLRAAYFGIKGGIYDINGYDSNGFDVFGFDLTGKDKNGNLINATENGKEKGRGKSITDTKHYKKPVVTEENVLNPEEMNDGKKKKDHKDHKDHKQNRPDRPDRLNPTPTQTYTSYTGVFTPSMTIVYPPTTPTITRTTQTIAVTVTMRYPCGPADGCMDDQTICDGDIPVCVKGMCNDGFYNSMTYPASECLPTDHGILGMQNVAMSCDGMTIVQGVPQNVTYETGTSIPNQYFRGQATAWYYSVNNSRWQEVQILRTRSGRISDWYGNSVDVCASGNRIVVGAFLDSFRHRRGGSVYVFDWDESVGYYREVQQLIASDTQPFDYFGSDVKISGDCNTIVVGAYGNDAAGNMTGAAYVFQLGDLPPTPLYDPLVAPVEDLLVNDGKRGIFYEVDKLLPSDPRMNMYYGQALAVSWNGSDIFVGGSNTRAVYHYRVNDTTLNWDEKQVFTNKNAFANGQFGESVATNANATYLAIGAPNMTDGTSDTVGRVFTYRWDGGKYVPDLATSTPLEPPVIDDPSVTYTIKGFGYSLAMSCDANAVVNADNQYRQVLTPPDKTGLLIGAPFSNYNGVDNLGAAFLYKRNPTLGWGYSGLMFNATTPPLSGDYSVLDTMGFGAAVATNNNATKAAIADFNAKIDIFVWDPTLLNPSDFMRR